MSKLHLITLDVRFRTHKSYVFRSIHRSGHTRQGWSLANDAVPDASVNTRFSFLCMAQRIHSRYCIHVIVGGKICGGSSGNSRWHMFPQIDLNSHISSG